MKEEGKKIATERLQAQFEMGGNVSMNIEAFALPLSLSELDEYFVVRQCYKLMYGMTGSKA